MPRLLTFTFLAALGGIATADDCLVSTNPPELIESYPGVSEQHFAPDEGKYSAILGNGDLIMLRYGRCELAMTSSYFSLAESIDQTTITTWASSLISSSAERESMEREISAHGASFSPGDKLIVDAGNGSHSIVLVPSESPYFSVSARYKWIPPEH